MPVLTSYQLAAPYYVEWSGPGTLVVVNQDTAASITVSVHTEQSGDDFTLANTGDELSLDLSNVTDFRITASQYPATISLVVTPLAVSVSPVATTKVQNLPQNILNAAGVTRYAGTITVTSIGSDNDLAVSLQPNDSAIIVLAPVWTPGTSALVMVLSGNGNRYGQQWAYEPGVPIIVPVSPSYDQTYIVSLVVTASTQLPLSFIVLVDTEPLDIRVANAALRPIPVAEQIRGAGNSVTAGTITVGSLPTPSAYGQAWSCARIGLSVAANGTSPGATIGSCILYVYDGTNSYYLAQAVIEESNVTQVDLVPPAPLSPAGLSPNYQWTIYLVISNIFGTGSYDWAVITDWIPTT